MQIYFQLFSHLTDTRGNPCRGAAQGIVILPNIKKFPTIPNKKSRPLVKTDDFVFAYGS